jgi:hypothetical protein
MTYPCDDASHVSLSRRAFISIEKRLSQPMQNLVAISHSWSNGHFLIYKKGCLKSIQTTQFMLHSLSYSFTFETHPFLDKA